MKILGKNIKIRYFKENCNTDGYMGRSDVKRNEITICEDMPVENQEETLLHETMHIISNVLGAELKEEIIQQMSVALYSVFKDNNINWRLLK